MTVATWPVAYSAEVEKSVNRFVKFGALVGITVEPFQRLIVREIFAGRQEIVVMMPRGNGKTTLMALYSLYHLLTHPEPAVYCAAAARHQAAILWEETRRIAMRSKAVSDRLTFRHNEIRTANGFMRVMAADAENVHGGIPTLLFCDELHAHKNNKLFVALQTSLGKNPDACLCTISSAGYDEDGTLGKLRTGFLAEPDKHIDDRLTFIYKESARSSFFEWALRESDDYKDIDLVKRANPASWITEQLLREQLNKPGLPEVDFLRFRCNRWAKAQGDWIPAGSWDKCYEKNAAIPLGSQIVLGVDIGIKRDSSAVVALWKREDGRVVVLAKVWTPLGDGTAFETTIVRQYIRDLASQYRVTAVAYDPWSFKESAELLMAEGLPMVEVPMSNVRTVPATLSLMEAIKGEGIVHDGNRILSAHVGAGGLQDTERGVRLTKKAKNPIDALMALMIGFTQVNQQKSGYEDHGLRWFVPGDDDGLQGL